MPYWFDGNNLIGQSAAAAMADAKVRRAFLESLCSLRRSGGGRFLVYFDGDDPGRPHALPGVLVRYSAPKSTDEAIVSRLRETQHPSEVIVVTNDRALITRCRNEGAKALTWREFTSKMRARSIRKKTQSTSEKAVDVEDWLQYFGLDKRQL
jgi:predicted RNA-binding protein with PIN domain